MIVDVKKILVFGLLGLDLLALNAGVGYLGYKFELKNPQPPTTTITSGLSAGGPSPIPAAIECGSECQAEVRRIVAEELAKEAGQSGKITTAPTPKPVYITAPGKAKVRSIDYVTIPGSGSTNGNIWTDLAGTEFYFDPGDYPGLVEVYFEANMKLFNGNGMAYVRLYDATNGIGVQGSETLTNSQANVVVASGQVSFWKGRNLVKVQGKSLTADTVVYNSGRLKIVTEN